MTDQVYLETPSRKRQSEFLRLVHMSRRLHRGWVTPPDTGEAFAGYLKRCGEEDFRGFLVCDLATDTLVGVFNLSQIARGTFQSAYLGFYAFQPGVHCGFMSDALGLVMGAAFGPMKLHRLEANVQVSNAASKAFVAKNGFRLEGVSPRYLKISGRWRDHERWAILREEWRMLRAGKHVR